MNGSLMELKYIRRFIRPLHYCRGESGFVETDIQAGILAQEKYPLRGWTCFIQVRIDLSNGDNRASNWSWPRRVPCLYEVTDGW